MKKTRKLLATLLTFAMLFGTTLLVRAEGNTYQVTDITDNQVLPGGSTISASAGAYMEILIDRTSVYYSTASYTLPTTHNFKVYSVMYNSMDNEYILDLDSITPAPPLQTQRHQQTHPVETHQRVIVLRKKQHIRKKHI